MKPAWQEGLERYRDHYCPTGSFLQAVLENNLMEAFSRADEYNKANMFEIVRWVYTSLPRAAWGSPEAVSEWLARRQA